MKYDRLHCFCFYSEWSVVAQFPNPGLTSGKMGNMGILDDEVLIIKSSFVVLFCKIYEALKIIVALHVMQCRNRYNCHEPQHLRNEKRGSGCLWIISYVCSWQGKLCLLKG